MEMLKPLDAAKLMGVSYPTLKQWIYADKVRSVKTPGGHHRVPRSEVDRITGARQPTPSRGKKPSGLEAISGRNKLMGTVTDVKFEGLLAQVTINVGGQPITSIITRDACLDLGLKKGVRAFALIKATEVMVIRGWFRRLSKEKTVMPISARNRLTGTVTDIKLGGVMAHVTIEVGQNVIESVITRQSAEELNLQRGDTVTAVVKATEVMISK
jgi:molybdopterin-binding protein